MKKVTYLLALVFALTLMSFSCSKDEDDPIVPQTLEQQYPDWTNLSWVSTDGLTTSTTYPKIGIDITGDVAHLYYETDVAEYDLQYHGFTANTYEVSFTKPFNGSTSQTLTIVSDSPLTLEWDSHTFVLQ